MVSFITTSSLGAGLAAASLLGAMTLATPMTGNAAEPKQVAVKAKAQPGDDVEARIKALHSELKIRPEQEPGWNSVAQQMRDNAKARAELHVQQIESERTASAPDMIDAYAKTMEFHADGAHKFASVFQKLYDDMSEQQKKTADAVFRDRVHKAAARNKS